MTVELRIFLAACVLVFAGIIVHSLVQKKYNLRYSLVWLFSAIGMLIVIAFPNIFNFFTDLIGIKVVSNAVFFFAIVFLVMIVLTLTSIVSKINNHIYRLTQTQAILEQRVRELEAQQKENQDRR